MGLPRAALLPDLARREGALQADGAGRRLGDHSAAVHDADLHALLRQARGDALRGIPYPIFAFAGLLPWTFFSNAVTNSGNSLVGSSNLITKVYFPRMIIPGAAVAAGLVDFAIAFVILGVLVVYYGIALTWSALMLPVLVLMTALLALGVGMWTSGLNVKYRDVRHALPFLIQLWFFATPIVYPTTIVPARWRWLMALNPMSGIIDGYRAAIFGTGFDLRGLAISAGVTLILLVYSAYAFRRMEKTFADIV